MAHKVLGSTWGSHSVKVVELEVGFRTAQATAFHSAYVTPGDEPVQERALRTLTGLLTERGLAGEIRHEALAGEQLVVRLLTLPFTDAKKIEQVIGYELEGQIARDLETLIVDHHVLPALGGFQATPRPEGPPADAAAPPAPGSAAAASAGAAAQAAASLAGPGGAAAPAPVMVPQAGTAGTRVLVAAAVRSQIHERLNRGVAVVGSEPRSLLGAPLVFGRVVAAAEGASDAGGPIGVLDLGHVSTTLSVVQAGVTLFTRTIPRAGKHLTAAIAKRYQMDLAQAEQVKHSSGFVVRKQEVRSLTPDQAEMHSCVATELAHVIRDLRQTLAAYRTAFTQPLAKILTCGGTARLSGLHGFLSEALDVRVEPMRIFATPEIEPLAGKVDLAAVTPELAIALGVGLEGASGRPTYDFRQDEFSYRADYSFLRGKAIAIASAALVLIALAAITAWSELWKLKKEERLLEDRFAQVSSDVLGMEIDPADVSEHIRPAKAEDSPLPTMTAYDLFDEISQALPPRDKLKLDILEMEIKPRKISMKASVGNAKQAEEFETALKTVKCLGKISPGKMTSTPSSEEKTYTLTVEHSCL